MMHFMNNQQKIKLNIIKKLIKSLIYIDEINAYNHLKTTIYMRLKYINK